MPNTQDQYTFSMYTDALRQHRVYYLPDGDLHFLVGRTRFRIHSFFLLRESKYWSNRIGGSFSPDMNYDPPGFDESTALLIQGVEAEDFALLLWIFYNPRYDTYDTSLENWEKILRLATKWECQRIREVAIEHIDQLPGVNDVQKIKIYRDNDVPQKFLIPLYAALANRPNRLERAEFQYLDSEDLYYIVTAREMLRAPPSPSRDLLASPIRGDITEEDRDGILAVAFGTSAEEIHAIMSPITDPGASRF